MKDQQSPSRPPPAPKPAALQGVSRGQVLLAVAACGATVAGASAWLPGSLSPVAAESARTRAVSVPATPPDGSQRDAARPPAPPEVTPWATLPAGGASDPVGTAGGTLTAQVRSMTARPGPGLLSVSWSLDGAPGDLPPATTVSSPGGATTASCPPRRDGCTATGLTPGVPYTVTLTVGQVRAKSTAIPYPATLGAASTRLWFDPSAPGGITAATTAPGSRVRTVVDNSRYNADAVPAADMRPPTVTTLSGHRALSFRGGSGLAFPAASLPDGTASATVYLVAKTTDADPERECFAQALSWGGNTRGGARIVGKGCSTSLAFADTFDTWLDHEPRRRWFTGSTHVVRADFTAAAISVWMDGAFSYRWPTTSDGLRTTKRATGTLGGVVWDPNISWRGTIGEVIVLAGVPSSTQDQAITDYLTRKWTP